MRPLLTPDEDRSSVLSPEQVCGRGAGVLEEILSYLSKSDQEEEMKKEGLL